MLLSPEIIIAGADAVNLAEGEIHRPSGRAGGPAGVEERGTHARAAQDPRETSSSPSQNPRVAQRTQRGQVAKGVSGTTLCGANNSHQATGSSKRCFANG